MPGDELRAVPRELGAVLLQFPPSFGASTRNVESLGMLLGALVIIVAWVLTWIYVRWANEHYDSSVKGLRR